MRLVAAAILGSAILGCMALASPIAAQSGLFWVVGSRINGCRIVQQNPVIDGSNIQFSDGPYRSEDDAKLAMTTISVCKT
ncbi:hypothetical protein [Bradyrhizobium prioriisuperbiae]|uniref:hypothetical protein n=1 Tax=Bradyrhizobium prioriisuperbiae TaxID=2854389 RepID=UPI0028EF2CBE|nr:hypothetical protein [Bradyrhizobium prioritasuperba]